MLSKQIRNSFLLLIAALIWGVAFVAQSTGMEHIGPFTFTFLRNVIGTVVLLPIAFFSKEKSESSKILIISAVLSGIALGIASCLQQYGMLYTSVGKAGFLTALYIIIVPIIGFFFKKKCSWLTWVAVLLAIIGVYFLCMTEEFAINKGDIYELLCAFAFSIQIMIISKYTERINAYRFACIQFFTAGLVAFFPMLLTETIGWSGVSAAMIPLLYTGVMSSGVAYTLQIIGERDLNPTVAALIMSLESCISVLAGWILINQTLSTREIVGCVIMFISIILAQIKK